VREDARILLWCWQKLMAGDALTEEERQMANEANERRMANVKKYFGLRPEQYKYEKGKGYKD